MLWTVPNRLSLARILLIPLIVAAFLWPEPQRALAAGLFALAAATDWLDGYLARRHGWFSPFGAFLDPVADKLLVATVLLLILADRPDPGLTVAAGVIVGRELLITALREWMAGAGQRDEVAVGGWGKWKTTVQMIALLGLLYVPPGGGGDPVFRGLLFIAALLTAVSAARYLRAAWPYLTARG